MTVVCPHTAISAKRSVWLLWRMGTWVQFGFFTSMWTVRKTILCITRKAPEKMLLVHSPWAAVASALTNGFLCVQFFTAEKGS